MKYYLAALKRETGSSEQFLIIKLLKYAFENNPEIAPYREKLKAEWEEYLNNNKKI